MLSLNFEVPGNPDDYYEVREGANKSPNAKKRLCK
ncbi:hypothetical protein STW0522ENT60_28460 [Enterobacter kobei]|nr:hypothetical protein STW0522ENT60_28460 [Enterobacter kobei]